MSVALVIVVVVVDVVVVVVLSLSRFFSAERHPPRKERFARIGSPPSSYRFPCFPEAPSYRVGKNKNLAVIGWRVVRSEINSLNFDLLKTEK